LDNQELLDEQLTYVNGAFGIIPHGKLELDPRLSLLSRMLKLMVPLFASSPSACDYVPTPPPQGPNKKGR